MSSMSVNDRFVELVGVIRERQGLMEAAGVVSFDALSPVPELITFVVSTDDLVEVHDLNLVQFAALHGKAAGVALVVDNAADVLPASVPFGFEENFSARV